jgi:Holliday junction resolvasome RuvABC endonuclease subunit
MMDLNSLWNNITNIFMEITLSLYHVVEKVFQAQMLQSIVNIIKGVGMIMVAVVEAFLRVLKMIVH